MMDVSWRSTTVTMRERIRNNFFATNKKKEKGCVCVCNRERSFKRKRFVCTAEAKPSLEKDMR